MLKKLEYYWNEDGKKVDILDDKIYWDGKQFRHKFNCCKCNKNIGCRCYETLESALKGVEERIICDTCGINNALNDLYISDIVDMFSDDDDRVDKIEKYIDTLIDVNEIKQYLKEYDVLNVDFYDKMEIIEGADKEDKLREYAINLLTYDEKWDNWVDSCDCDAEGESCGIK